MVINICVGGGVKVAGILSRIETTGSSDPEHLKDISTMV